MELRLSLETGFDLNLHEGGGGGGAPLWTPANMSNPPHISINADRLDLLTKDGSDNLTAVTTEFTGLAAGTITAVTHTTANANLGGKGSFNVTATVSTAQVINFASTAGDLLANKNGCTMVFVGRFNDAGASALNRAIVNATTTSNNSSRCSIATSTTVANNPRYTVRRLDGDVANGDDIAGGNRGTSPIIMVLRLDHLGAVVGAGTPTKEMIVIQGGVRTTASEPTGLGSGPFSNTNSALIGFFNSGTVAYAKNDMNWGAIDDEVWTNDQVERVIGWAAWKINNPTMLEVGNPYRNAPPVQT